MERRRHVLTAQLLRLSILCLFGIELIRLDLHAVLQQRHLSTAPAAPRPAFTECRQECFFLVIGPWLHVLRSGDVGIKTPGRSPYLRPEPVGLDLFLQRLPERRDRALVPARIPGGIPPELYELRPRNIDIAPCPRRDPEAVRRIVCRPLRIDHPFIRNQSQLVPALTVRVRKDPERGHAHEHVFHHDTVPEVICGLISIRPVQ